LPVLLYGTEVCPTNAAGLQSMQFTINRVIIKLFGTMSQNYYQEVSNYFGINTVKELIRNRFEKFKISYGAADNYLCRLISAKCWLILTVLYIFFLFLFVSFLATVFWRWNKVICNNLGLVSVSFSRRKWQSGVTLFTSYDPYLLLCSVSGCANPDVPANTWFRRTADGRGQMGCRHSSDTAWFHCVDNVWRGSFINCSERQHLHHRNIQS